VIKVNTKLKVGWIAKKFDFQLALIHTANFCYFLAVLGLKIKILFCFAFLLYNKNILGLKINGLSRNKVF
jgi:hypothetical protein